MELSPRAAGCGSSQQLRLWLLWDGYAAPATLSKRLSYPHPDPHRRNRQWNLHLVRPSFPSLPLTNPLHSFITTPIERLKVIQQCAPATSPQPSLFHLLRTNSIPSLYRGLTATILRDVAYGPYFLTYEAICRSGTKERSWKADLVEEVEAETREVGWGRLLVAGGAAGIVGWGSTCVPSACAKGEKLMESRFAMDVVKTRIQSTEPWLPPDEKGVRVAHPFRTTWSTIVNSYRGEGAKVFTAGLGPTLLRAIPVNMVRPFASQVILWERADPLCCRCASSSLKPSSLHFDESSLDAGLRISSCIHGTAPHSQYTPHTLCKYHARPSVSCLVVLQAQERRNEDAKDALRLRLSENFVPPDEGWPPSTTFEQGRSLPTAGSTSPPSTALSPAATMKYVESLPAFPGPRSPRPPGSQETSST